MNKYKTILKEIREECGPNTQYIGKVSINNWMDCSNFEQYYQDNRFQDFSGCYVFRTIEGKTKCKITYDYAGQSNDVLKRIRDTLYGRGSCPEVYISFLNGKHIEVGFLPCPKNAINDLERRLIAKYKTHNNRKKGGSRTPPKHKSVKILKIIIKNSFVKNSQK